MKQVIGGIKGFAVAAVALAMSGCASGPSFVSVDPPPHGQGQVYLYRPWQLPGGAASMKIILDGKQTELTLPNNSWERLTLDPGHHELGLTEYLNTFSCGGAQFSVEAGQTLFMSLNFTMSSPDGSRTYIGCGLAQRNEAAAMKDIAGMRRSK